MSTTKHTVPEELLAGLLADYKKSENLSARMAAQAIDQAAGRESSGCRTDWPLWSRQAWTGCQCGGQYPQRRESQNAQGRVWRTAHEVPRDRHDTFEPQLIRFHAHQILSMPTSLASYDRFGVGANFLICFSHQITWWSSNSLFPYQRPLDHANKLLFCRNILHFI